MTRWSVVCAGLLLMTLLVIVPVWAAMEGFIEVESVLVRVEGAEVDTARNSVNMEAGGRLLLGVPVEAAGMYRPALRRCGDAGGFSARVRFEGTPTVRVVWTPARETKPGELHLPWLRLARGDTRVVVECRRGDFRFEGLLLERAPQEAGVLEAESLTGLTALGSAALDIAGLEPEGMSGYSGLRIAHAHAGDGVALVWKAARAGSYAVALRLREGPARPTVVLTLNGDAVGEPMAPRADGERWPETLYTRTLPHVEAGEHRLCLVLAEGAASGETLIDYLRVWPSCASNAD
jgi:hypothetical protein